MPERELPNGLAQKYHWPFDIVNLCVFANGDCIVENNREPQNEFGTAAEADLAD